MGLTGLLWDAVGLGSRWGEEPGRGISFYFGIMAVNRVMVVFTIASMVMWILPIGVLEAFNWNLIPGLENMSPRSRTLWSGALAVLCVNIVIAAYIFLALHETTPATDPQPDPVFLRRAKESVAAVNTRPSTSEHKKSGQVESEKSGKAE